MDINKTCKYCKKRTVGCHSVCDKYNAFKDELNKIREKKVEANVSNEYFRTKYLKITG